jgi:hypothetical protein
VCVEKKGGPSRSEFECLVEGGVEMRVFRKMTRLPSAVPNY